jgi:hypothetical protein
MTRRQAAAWRRVSVSTVQFWVDRYRAASEEERASGAWAEDRPSTPHHQLALSSAAIHDRVCEARERTGWGPRPIASELGWHTRPPAAVYVGGGCRGCPVPSASKFAALSGLAREICCKWTSSASRASPTPVTGSLAFAIARAEERMNVGWEFCHSMIDDHSRLAFTEIHDDEKAATVIAFVGRALAFLGAQGLSLNPPR